MGVRVDHSVGVPFFLESCVAPFTCSLEWSLTSVYVAWFRRDLGVSRVPRGPESGSRVGELVLLLLLLLLLHLLLPHYILYHTITIAISYRIIAFNKSYHSIHHIININITSTVNTLSFHFIAILFKHKFNCIG